MNIKIMTKDVSLTPADNKYIWNRMYFALAANQQYIDSAEVSLCAIRGFESERMYFCRVEIYLVNGNAVIGDSSESDIYVTIDHAVDHACSRVAISAEPQWQTISQRGPVASRNNRLGVAAYAQDSL